MSPTTPRLSQRLADQTAGLARRIVRGTPLQRLRITGLVYTHLMRHAQHSPDGRLRISFRGATFDVPAGDTTIVPTLRDGTYEQREIDAFTAALEPGMRVADVGANVGVFSVLSALRVGSSGEVVSFEPFPDNVRFLTDNAVLNGCQEQLRVVEACVGDCGGTVKLGIAPGQSGTHAVGLDATTHLDCRMTTLDEEFAGQRVDAVKIDVEGLEEAVLAGARVVLSRDEPLLLLEFGPSARVGTGIGAVVDDLLATIYHRAFFFEPRALREIRPGDGARLARELAYGNVLLVPASRASVGERIASAVDR